VTLDDFIDTMDQYFDKNEFSL